MKSSLPIRVLWLGVALLATIGVGAAIGRGVFSADFATRAEPLRRQILHSLHRNDPFAQQRAAELHAFDSRFAAHPLLTLLHVLPGGLFLGLLGFGGRQRIAVGVDPDLRQQQTPGGRGRGRGGRGRGASDGRDKGREVSRVASLGILDLADDDVIAW